jgi:hypothetical protein
MIPLPNHQEFPVTKAMILSFRLPLPAAAGLGFGRAFDLLLWQKKSRFRLDYFEKFYLMSETLIDIGGEDSKVILLP